MRASTVREVQKMLGLTQDEFARALMIKSSTVCRWKANKRRSIPMDVIRRLVLETLATSLKDATPVHSTTRGVIASEYFRARALDSSFQPSLIMAVLDEAWQMDCKRRSGGFGRRG